MPQLDQRAQRGGAEMGRWWYDDGKLLNKMNTFNDFIDCGKALVAKGYADPDRLYAAAWERTRRAWDFVESGEGSGIYRSDDGGKTWE